MRDEASKPVVVAVLLSVAFGMTTHVWYGIYLLARHAGGRELTVPVLSFLAAWFYLAFRCIQLPSGAVYRYDKSFPLFFGVMLPFMIPSAITFAALAISGLVTTSVAFQMLSGLIAIPVIPGLVLLCMRAASFYRPTQNRC